MMKVREKDSAEVIKILELRHSGMRAAREYFYRSGFLEVDSPILIPANCIETHIDPVPAGEGLYLHTSPEIYHKRLLSYGAKRIFQLGHVFRDGELGKIHFPEFAMLEWYRVGDDLVDLIHDCEVMFREVCQAVGVAQIFVDPFERRTMSDLWRELAQVDLDRVLEKTAAGCQNAMVEAVQSAGFYLRSGADFEDAFHHVMTSAIEPKIAQDRPCVVEKWPKQLAGLSRLCVDNPLFADRFEIYYRGIEIANAFAELTDSIEQKRRFEQDLAHRSMLGKDPLPINNKFLNDLEFMPSSVGIAVGFDRLLLLISGVNQIQNVHPLSWL